MVREFSASDATALDGVIGRAMQVLRRTYDRRPGLPPLPPEPDRGPQTRLVAVRDGAVCGTLTYQAGSDVLHISRLFVDPPLFRCGIARELLDHAAVTARALGKASLMLHTIRETGNVAVFSRLGFTVVDERHDPTIVSSTLSELHEVRMMRVLSTV